MCAIVPCRGRRSWAPGTDTTISRSELCALGELCGFCSRLRCHGWIGGGPGPGGCAQGARGRILREDAPAQPGAVGLRAGGDAERRADELAAHVVRPSAAVHRVGLRVTPA